MQPYDEQFFATCENESKSSASCVVPMLLDLFAPSSVVDVGCGIGTWLEEFRRAGVANILGIDGSYVNPEQLIIPRECFLGRDLTKPLQLTPPFADRYSLALSLEVAEHLPESSAATFVDSLVSLAPTIVFSAAIPHQGGTHHVNEQWPNYWARLFAARGYRTIDWLRPRLLNDPRVAYYYAQNCLFFIDESVLNAKPDLRPYVVAEDDLSLCRVHPARWMKVNDLRAQPIRKVLASLPFSLMNIVSRRLPNRRTRRTSVNGQRN
jgi:SAM-dependent methyltransferase